MGLFKNFASFFKLILRIISLPIYVIKRIDLDILFATMSGLILLLSFFLFLYSLPLFLNYTPHDLFIEHIAAFEVKDTSDQKKAYLFTLLLIPIIFFSLYFYSTRRKLNNYDNIVESDVGIPFVENFKVRAIHIALILIFVLIFGAMNNDLVKSELIAVGDPHIYYVTVELGETIRGGHEISPYLLNSYGLGPALLYLAYSYINTGFDYLTVFELARTTNILFFCFLLLLLWRLFQPQHAGKFGISTLLLATFLIGMPIGIYNSLYVTTHNISVVRYFPILILFLIYFLAPTKSNIFFTFFALIISAINMALFPDFGTFSALAVILFLITQHQFSLNKLGLCIIFIFILVFAFAATSYTTKTFLGIAAHEFLIAQLGRFSQNLGGIKIFWDPLTMVLIVSQAVIFFFYSYKYIQRALTYKERVAFSLSGCSIVSFTYYLNGPYNGYWIYIALWIPSSHVYINELYKRTVYYFKPKKKYMELHSGYVTIHVTARVFCLICLTYLFGFVIEQGYRTVYQIGFKDNWSSENLSDNSNYLGISTENDFVKKSLERIAELKNITNNRRDASIFTTTPYAVLISDVSDHIPNEIVFRNNNSSALMQTKNKILSEDTKYIIFEHEWEHGYKNDVAEKVVLRLQNSISEHYEFYYRNDYWEIWQKRQ